LLNALFFWDIALHHWVTGGWCFRTAWWSNLRRSDVQWRHV